MGEGARLLYVSHNDSLRAPEAHVCLPRGTDERRRRPLDMVSAPAAWAPAQRSARTASRGLLTPLARQLLSAPPRRPLLGRFLGRQRFSSKHNPFGRPPPEHRLLESLRLPRDQQSIDSPFPLTIMPSGQLFLLLTEFRVHGF